ncbi:GEVED domain-containing protein, partial [Flavobacterium rhizosphaerae]
MKENYRLFFGRVLHFLYPHKNMEQLQPGSPGSHQIKFFDALKKKTTFAFRPYAMAFLLALSVNGWSAGAAFYQDCTPAPVIAGVSNITSTTAVINWNEVSSVTDPTYTLEVYTDAAFTQSFGTYTDIDAMSYSLSGLTINTTYYYRVMVDNTTCGDYANGSFTAQEGYTPLDVTGFTQDVIANGTGLALNSTTASVDSDNPGANFAYMSLDYKLNEASPNATFGLPVNRRLTSSTNSSLQYILQDYSDENSLRLPNNGDSGTLTLTQPVALTNIYLATASGDGGSKISVTINFDDNTTQTVTNIDLINWDSAATANAPAIITNIGRVKRTTGVTSSGNFKLFQIGITVDAANQSKLVNSITITKTFDGSNTKIPNIFAVSGKLAASCIEVASSNATILSANSAELSWALASGNDATAVTYTVEVYTDENYTQQIEGSPFTGVTATSQVINGLSIATPYYYKIQASNETCDSAYATGSFTLEYCVPTSASPGSYNISSVTTNGGLLNINNGTGAGGAYSNYSGTQIVGVVPGGSFTYNVTRSSVYALVSVWVDWNNDLDFDDEGELINAFTYGSSEPMTVSGTINVPEETALGNYRMRVRSAYYWNTTMTPCGNTSYGETEDYTLAVIDQPEDCATPGTPSFELVAGAAITGTITPDGDAPTGYVVIRSTENTLDETPENGDVLSVGQSFGGGTVVAVGAATGSFTDATIMSNAQYHYFVYAYNAGGLDCYGPIYSDVTSEDIITCPSAVIASGVSDITNTSATINWSYVYGGGAYDVTYTLEVYSDAALTTLFDTYTTSENSYSVSGLTTSTTYYYRVKATTEGCEDGAAWSGVLNFVPVVGYTPVDVTGFNEDVIANGVGKAYYSTTNSVDAVNYVYIALDYNPTGTVTSVGVPLNRILSSGNVKFNLQDYSENNALRLPGQNNSGMLTLVNPIKASNLYLAVTSGSGGSTISAEVNFADGTSQLATGVSVPDWFGTGSSLITYIGRASRAENQTGAVETGASKIFYVTLAVDAANQSKLITSVNVTKTSAGATEPVPNVFGVAAQVIADDCPILSSVAVSGTPDETEVAVTPAPGSTEGDTYSVSVYTDEAMTTEITGSPFTSETSTVTITGLDNFTTYYYSVIAEGEDCDSNTITGSFTTTCNAPASLEVADQSVCTGALLSEIEVTGAEGATINWYASEDDTETLAGDTVLETGTYYVSQTTDACESNWTAVNITVNEIPAAPVAEATQDFCTGATAEELEATASEGATLVWY